MAVMLAAGSLTRSAPQYEQARGEGVSLLRLDEATGDLDIAGPPLPVDDVGWLVADPAHGQLLVVGDAEGGARSALVAIGVEPGTGRLSRGATVVLGGREGCHAALDAARGLAFVASYGGGGPGLAAVAVGPGGQLSGPVAEARHEGSGPHPERQEAPHAHCVALSPDGRTLYVVDLGLDAVLAYEVAPDEVLARAPGRDLRVSPGLGPRHLVFAPEGASESPLAYLVCELVPTVLALRADAATGALVEVGRHDIPDLSGRGVQPAGIVVHGRHLYVSLRRADEILVLERDTDGGLHDRGRVPSGGRTPRDLVLAPSGRHLVVANQDSDRVTVLPLAPDGGLGAPVGSARVGTPLCLAVIPPSP